MPKELKRRNLSGIYIFDTFPNDDRRKPTCIEDCRAGTRKSWMEKRDADYLRNLISELAKTFKEVTEYCHDGGAVKTEWRDEFNAMADSWIERSKLNWARHELADQIDMICDKITFLADAVGVTRPCVDDDSSITALD